MELSFGPFLGLGLAWFLNALWPLVGQSGARLYAPLLFTEAAFIVAFFSLAPSLMRERRWQMVFSRDQIPGFLAIGFFYGVPSLLYVAALAYTTPSSAGVVAEVEVIYSMFLSAWLLQETIGRRQIAASLMVISGTALILAHDLGSAKWKGDALIAGSAWMYQVSHILVKRLPKGLDPTAIAGARIFFEAAIFLIPVLLWSRLHPAHPQWTWSWPGLWLVFVYGAIITALSGAAWYAAIRAMDLAKATAFLLSYPALTMLLSWALGREAISALQIDGLLITMAGAIWLSLLMARAATTATVTAIDKL